MDKYSFHIVQKMVVFSKDGSEVLLCKRKGEADYEAVFSFIGGKMEITDASLIEGLRREKNEEVGDKFKLGIYTGLGVPFLFKKKDGSCQLLVHYYAKHISGEIKLSEEYSEYRWVKLEELASFEPKISNIPEIVKRLLIVGENVGRDDLKVI